MSLYYEMYGSSASCLHKYLFDLTYQASTYRRLLNKLSVAESFTYLNTR